MIFSVGLVVCGLLMLVYAAHLDARDMEDAPWGGTLLCPEGDAPWEGTIPIRVRWLPLINYPMRERVYTRLRDSLPRNELRALGLEHTELLIVADLPVEELRPLLASGRLPQPGRPEVLAGAFAQATEIHADDGDFLVVGRLKRNVAGLATAYLMPADEIWDPLFERTTTRGWLDPDGITKIRKLPDPRAFVKRNELIAGPAASGPNVALLSLAALTFIAAGGAGLHRAVFARLARRGSGVLGPALRGLGDHPALVGRLHRFFYGVFFFAMVAALLLPQMNALVLDYITHAFSEGSLGYVGRAYQSGNVLAAAAATWVNNFLLQTVVLTVLVSFIVPCVGLLKTLASFALVGFGMAPIWSGMASSYTFHSITMTLELEAYIYACAAVVIFWMQIGAAARRRSLAPAKDGLRVIASGTLLAGIMLAVAGLYEAATLILLR